MALNLKDCICFKLNCKSPQIQLFQQLFSKKSNLKWLDCPYVVLAFLFLNGSEHIVNHSRGIKRQLLLRLYAF
jgi:hypothetical protein